MDMASFNAGLSSLATNPLFNLGLGMLSTPYQRTPVSFGQVLGNGVSQMDYAQQQAAQAQTRQMQAQLLQQRLSESQAQAKAQAAQQAAAKAYTSALGPDASPDETYLAQTDPQKLAAQRIAAANANPWQYDSKSGDMVNVRTAQIRAPTLYNAPSPTGVSVPPTVPRVGMPPVAGQPYQATVPGTNGQNVSFNFPPGTPPQVVAAAYAEARANGDIAPNAVESPVGSEQAVPVQGSSSGTLAAYRAAHAASGAKLPAGYQWNAEHTAAVPIPGVKQPGTGIFGEDQNSFSPDAQRLLAVATEQGLKIPIPSVGMGGAARVQFVNGLASDIVKKQIPFDLALQEMRFGLDADPGLKKSQSLYSTTKTLEAGADNLAQQAVQTAQSVGRGNVPVFNAWVNAGRRATGDPNVARFDRAINAFVNDYAKVVSGSLGSAASSDSARKQAEEQLTAAQSPEQFAASVDQMQKEMHVRTSGMLDSIRQQVESVGHGGMAQPGAPTFGAQRAPAIPPQAIMYLKSHPGTRAQFDAQFGAGAAAKALGN